MSDRGYGQRGYDKGGYRSRGGGGGYRDRRPGDGQRRQDDRGRNDYTHQRSFVGQKRGREQSTYDPKTHIIKRLLRLGEPGALGKDEASDNSRTPAATVASAAKIVATELKNGGMERQLRELLLQAVCGCPHKTTYYAELLGLLQSEHGAWVAEVVEDAGQQLAAGLADEAATPAPRLLLRFLCCLPVMGVLTHTSVAELLQELVNTATQAAIAGAARDPTGVLWQPWTDHLVYAALAALPWCGSDLAVHAGADLQQVLSSAEAYLALRPQQEEPGLRPYYGAGSAADAADAGDSGGATFLPTLLTALKACQEQQAWQVSCLERPPVEHEQRLARNTPGELPHMELPTAPPAVANPTAPGDVAVAAAAAALREAYPPRGGLVLFDHSLLGANVTDVEVFVGEELIKDLLITYDGHRVELAQVLTTALPVIGSPGALLAQVLLGQLLRLPGPALPPSAYVTLVVDVCKLQTVFAKYYAGGVRRLFDRCDYLDPQLRMVLASALAHHVSNFGWVWPWDRFKVLEQSPDAAQRGWVALVLSHMVRLSYYDNISQVLSSSAATSAYQELLGPEPQVRRLPTKQTYPPAPTGNGDSAPAAADGAPDAAQPAIAPQPSWTAEGDVTMTDANQSNTDGVEAMDVTAEQPSQQQQQQQQQQPPDQEQEQQQQNQQGQQEPGSAAAAPDPGTPRVDEPSGEDPEGLWAGRLLATLTSRKPGGTPGEAAPRMWGAQPAPPPAVPLTFEDVLAWMQQVQMRAQLGEPLAFLRAVMRALLAAASKSLTHIHVLLERYAPLLFELVEEVGQGPGGEALLGLVGDMYEELPARLHTALDKLVALRLVTVQHLVRWVVTCWPVFTLGPSSNPVAAALAWEVLDVTLGDAAARADEAAAAAAGQQTHVAAAQTRVSEAEAAAQELAQELAAAGEAAEGAAEGQPTGPPLSRQMQVAAAQQHAAQHLQATQQAAAGAQQAATEAQQALAAGLQEALLGLRAALSSLDPALPEASRQLAWAQVRAFMRSQARRYLALLGPQLEEVARELEEGHLRDVLLGPLGLRSAGQQST